MSEQVMTQAKPQVVHAKQQTGGILQRKCACGQHTASGGECEECRKKREGTIQRAAISTAPTSGVPPIVHDVLSSPGKPLDAGTRGFMEPRFGHDFSGVRVHTDAKAAESARAVDAWAYTVGHDVVFDSGQYSPTSVRGRALLAHELTHVVQQSGSLHQRAMPISIADCQGPLEDEAQAQARGIDLQLVSRAVASRIIQRSGKNSKPQAGHCGGAYSCSFGDTCISTDNIGPFLPEKAEGAGTWQLKVYIDVDVATSEDIVSGDDVGHTYVEFIGSTGARYSYGFYPRPEKKPDEFHTKVFGCIVHPDTNHTSCVDYFETFNLTRAQYEKALKFAQDFCKAPENYDLLSENCTTFAQFVAKVAGQTLPGIRGPVAKGATSADNPNTLLKNLQERDRKAIPVPAPPSKQSGEK